MLTRVSLVIILQHVQIATHVAHLKLIQFYADYISIKKRKDHMKTRWFINHYFMLKHHLPLNISIIGAHMSSALAFPRHCPCSDSPHYLALHTQTYRWPEGHPSWSTWLRKPVKEEEKPSLYKKTEAQGRGGVIHCLMSHLWHVRELVPGIRGSDYNDSELCPIHAWMKEESRW